MDNNAAEKVTGLLNDALALDPAAISALILNRAPCNKALANHPGIICGKSHGRYTVGLLSLLNGLLDGTGQRIAVRMDEDYVAISGFVLVPRE